MSVGSGGLEFGLGFMGTVGCGDDGVFGGS